MKTLGLVCVVGLLLVTGAVAQSNVLPSSAKAVTIAGTLSLDGKTLVTDLDNMWTISNAEALKGHEGQHVTVKCHVSPDKQVIQVFFIKAEGGGTKQATNWGDSAFRR
jgi:hypothetical protein